jgi:hypothetical protein
VSRSATGPAGGLSSPVLVVAVAAAVVIATVVLLSRDGEPPAPGAATVVMPAAATPSPPAPGVSPPPPAPAAVGPTTVVSGVAMGYAHSPAGAEAAAVGFLRLDSALVAMSDETASAAKRVIASSSAAEALVADVVAKLGALRKGYPGGATLYRIGVLASRVTPANADRVRVELWHVGVISPPAAAPYEEWTTQRYELVWERDDWRVAGEASTPGPRPLPLPQGEPSGPGQLEAALAGFGPLGVAR